MLFSSLTFLFVFFPLTILLYFSSKSIHFRNLILLASSLFFYAWGEPRLIFLMLLVIILNYYLTILMDSSSGRKRKILFILILLIDIGILIVYKYSNFLIRNINDALSLSINEIHLTMPIGVSFYTFQILSYVIDVYRFKFKAQEYFINLAVYIVLFPQLIAGPIVRYSTIKEELASRVTNLDYFASGLRRFLIGLAKKILIANQVAIVANTVFTMELSTVTPLHVWLGSISFMFQIYFDFSGYSDMAIGLGKIFGFHFLENFDYPYISKSITEFWKRWHISLSSWFRDYVYIPLGGNKNGYFIWFRNIIIVWLLTGLWHGAAWNFVLWGLYFGIVLILEKVLIGGILRKLPILNYFYTMLIVLISWIIFNGNSTDQILHFIKLIFTPINFDRKVLIEIQFGNYWIYYLFAFIGSFPILRNINSYFKKNTLFHFAKNVFVLVLFILSVIYLVDSSYNPFIYFRF